MKSIIRSSAACAFLFFVLSADAAVPTLSSPANDACLATLKGSTTEEGSHKWFFYGKTAAERKALMNGGASATLRAKMGNAYGDHPKATTFSWSGTGPFTLTIKRRDGSVFLEKSGIAGTSLSVDNFEIAASYTWTVSNADGASTPRAFTTEDTVPRLLNGSSQVDYTQGSVTTKVPHGVRDMGGYIGLDGRRARQGLLIRNSAFESDANSEGDGAGMRIKYIDDTNRPFWNEFIKVRTEIDLRNNSESTLTQSTLGSGVTYKRFTNLPAWKKYMTGTYASSFKRDVKGIFGYLADAGRYPISFHCTHGKDRTGMVAFLIGSVLGYSESDIYADYEATIFWHPTQPVALETSEKNGFLDFLNDSAASGVTGATIQEKTVNFIRSCGVTDMQLEAFREIMLEPIEEDEPEEPPEPVVTPMENPAWGYVIGGLGETADETAYVFTNTTAAMSWTAPLGVSSVELLVVGGGGAGGDNHSTFSIGGGGGGAGGYVYSKPHAVTGNQSYSVSVGAGARTAAVLAGGDSAFGDITAKGGGCGGVLSVGQAGGSGGGSSGKKGSSAKYAGGTGIAGQGFVGGAGDGWWKSNHVDSGTGGGGGGAGSKGGDAPNDEQGGIGGAGKTCAITGEEIVYCAGGGGGTDSGARTYNEEKECDNGIGGVGAGDGGDKNGMNGGDATGYGCGGGGAAGNRDAGQTGGKGFQGVVVVRCAKPAVEVVIGEMVGRAKSGQSVLPADVAAESVEIAADGRSFTWGGRTYEKPHYLFVRNGEAVVVRIDPAEAAVQSVDAEGTDDTFVIGTVLQSVVGFDYSVSYADDLLTQPEGWDRTEPVAGTGGPLELKAPKSGPQRFYRLVVGDRCFDLEAEDSGGGL